MLISSGLAGSDVQLNDDDNDSDHKTDYLNYAEPLDEPVRERVGGQRSAES